MINTLRGNNDSFANGGDPAIQPIPDSSVINQSQNQPTLPVRQVSLTLPVFSRSPDRITTVREPTLSNVVNLMSSDRNFVFPVFTLINNIVPTHALTLDAGRTYDPRVTQGFVTTNTKFQPYEQLTGISHERPEIIMLTNFQPLFDVDVSHAAPQYIGAIESAGMPQFITDAGRYLDAQFHMKNLRVFDMQQQIRMLRKKYPDIQNTFTQKANDFTRGVLSLREDSSFLLNTVRVIESQKMQLDLRHDLYLVEPTTVATDMVQNFSYNRLLVTPAQTSYLLTAFNQVGSKDRYDCVDCLVDLGYTEDSVKNVFSSTKIWLQLISELKNILQHHSLKFLDIDPSFQRKDDNASSITKSNAKLFEIADTLPTLPVLDDLISVQVNNIAQSINLLQPVFTSLYQNVFFKNEEMRLAALAHLISREFRYSRGLSYPNAKNHLKNFYGFQVNEVGNLSVFDSVLGQFGNNINDFPETNNVTLSALAQQRTTTAGILTFETKYVEGDTGTLIPGGEFYFDRILQTDGSKFDTSAIDELSQQLQNHADNFNVISDSLNLLSIGTVGPRQQFSRDTNEHFLESASDIIYELGDRLLNTQNGVVQREVSEDLLGAVFTHARTDNRVKTILFLYTLCRISRAYTQNVPYFTAKLLSDNTPVVDDLVEKLISTLELSVREARSGALSLAQDERIDYLFNEQIRSALKSGTVITQMIEQFMSSVLTQFRTKTTAITGNRTRYSAYLDTVVMMMAFDFAIGMVAKYSNQKIVGILERTATYSQGIQAFLVFKTVNSQLASFNELTQRINSEENIARQLLLTVFNTLRKLSGSLKGASNYLNSIEVRNKLREIASVLNNDSTIMRLLLTQQQISLIAATTEGLVAAQNSVNHASSVAILDDSEVAPRMHQALLGYFGAGDFASQSGVNKRILTVGVPLGFSQRLKQKVNIREQKRNSFENKQNDIIQVTVYKADIQNADIVYRPLRFLFEMSRFPLRFSTQKWLQMPKNPTLSDIINSIPTQNFDQNPDVGSSNSITQGIEYASTVLADKQGIMGARMAFDSAEYRFLTEKQKSELLHNHVVSQLLEVYVKLMTGMDVAEHTYHLGEIPPFVNSDTIRELTNHALAHVVDTYSFTSTGFLRGGTSTQGPSPGVMFSDQSSRPNAPGADSSEQNKSPDQLSNHAGVAGDVSSQSLFLGAQSGNTTQTTLEQTRVTTTADQNMDQLNHRHVPLIINQLRTISGFSHTLSSLSSVESLKSYVLSPKQFDRVFNVVVDARDFEIDVTQTIKTPHGRTALDLLIKHGDVIPVDPLFQNGKPHDYLIQTFERALENQNGVNPNVNRFKFRDRDKTQGDMVADKYFVTIETFGEDEI